jgi:hypothetical protein
VSILEEILLRIEILRQAMEDLYLKNGIHDPEVIALSQQIDILLNEYYILRHRHSALK